MKITKEQYRIFVEAIKKLKREPEDISGDADFSTGYDWANSDWQKAVEELGKIIEQNEELGL